jgi:hypothetical protein
LQALDQPVYDFDDDFEAFKQEILASHHPSALEATMKKLRRVHANTHVVPLAEPDPIRVTRKVERPWKKRKGSGRVQKRDDTHAEIVEAQIKKAQARKARQKAGLSK